MNMQWIVLLILLLAQSAFSQTNAFKSVLVTNWYAPNKSLRVVNGTLYDASKSKLWGSPIQLTTGLQKISTINSHPIRNELVAKRVLNGIVFSEIDAVTYWWETYSGRPKDESRDPVKTVVIFHYENPAQLVSGQAFNCLCMRVDNYVLDGVSYEAYDCGSQYTNLIPIVTSKKVKIQ